MAGVGGSVDDRTIAEVAEGVRALLTAIDDGRMSCSPAYRNRLQGAVVVLDALAAGLPNDRLRDGQGRAVVE